MPTRYEDVDAQCPYYLASGKKTITCEGITDVCTNTSTFISQEEKRKHRAIFCDNKYTFCEIYNMLEKKYEE